MKISVITVVLNNAETIGDCIRSVVEQDYQNLEYIIIDGGSTDGTLDIIKNFQTSHLGRISQVIVGKDKGIYDAMNKGISHTTGDLVGILNSDDFYAHHQVLSKVAALVNKTGADSCYADLQYVKRDDTSHIVRHWRSGSYNRKQFLAGWMPPHPTFFIKRACYDQFGRFDLSLKSAADYELMLRMLFKNHVTTCYLPEVIIRMRVGGLSNQNVGNRLKANQEDRMAWEKNGLKPHFYTIPMKPLRKLPQFILGKLGLAGKL